MCFYSAYVPGFPQELLQTSSEMGWDGPAEFTDEPVQKIITLCHPKTLCMIFCMIFCILLLILKDCRLYDTTEE